MPRVKDPLNGQGNRVRNQESPQATPAMAAGVTDKLWSLEDIVRVLDEWEAAQKVA